MLLDSIFSKRVLVRFDFNVPMHDGKIVNDFRIRQSVETIQKLLQNKNKIIIVSHLGRPKEGVYNESLSLRPISKYLSILLNQEIEFIKSYENKISFDKYDIAMLENVRFNVGEKSCSQELSKSYASLADCFVFDAFGVSHRKESTTFGVSGYLDTYSGVNILTETMFPSLEIAAVLSGGIAEPRLTLKRLLTFIPIVSFNTSDSDSVFEFNLICCASAFAICL